MNKKRPLSKTILAVLAGIICLGGLMLFIADSYKPEYIVLSLVSGIGCILFLRKPVQNNLSKEHRNPKSIIRTIFAVIFSMYSLFGIMLTVKHSKIEFGGMTVFFGIISFRLWRKTLQEYKDQKSSINIDEALSCNRTTQQTSVPTISPYIDVNNVTYRTDNQPISDDEIPDLMQRDYEEALQREAKRNSTLNRTEHDDELGFQFMMSHGYDIEKHTSSFENMKRLAYEEQDLNKRIVLLEKTISLYEKEKAWFYRTKGGRIHFEDFYEHLHNSNNQDFSWIDSVKDSLDYSLYIRDEVIPEIMQVITASDELMQKDIYAYIPDIPKSVIQQTLRELESDNLIVRTKKGNSYLLSLGSCPYKS